MNPGNGGWVVLLTIMVAMVFAVFHLPEHWPDWMGWLRPNWLLLVLFFWVMELPHRLGLFAAWFLGIAVDALVGEPLGLNAFIFAGFTYVTWSFYERLRMYSVVQQCGVVFMLVMVAEGLRSLVLGMGSNQGFDWNIAMIALVSALIWPFIYLFLLRVRTVVKVE